MDHPVELSFIFGLWKAYKMISETVQTQMRLARGRGMQGYIAEIVEDSRWRASAREKAETSDLNERSLLNVPKHPLPSSIGLKI